MEPLFHITTPDDWMRAQEADLYTLSTRGRTLNEVGFIHCSFAHQVEAVAEFVFAGVPTVTVLVIDPARLAVEVRVENLDGGADPFPHIYGPLPVDAVVDAITIHANGAGRFHLPRR